MQLIVKYFLLVNILVLVSRSRFGYKHILLVDAFYVERRLRLEPSCTQVNMVQGDTKKRELLKNPTKIEEIQEKKFIDRN